MPISTWILGFCILAQGALLAVPHGKKAYRFAEVIAGMGFLGAAISLVVLHFYDGGLVPLWTALLEDQPLFRLPRAALFLGALLLGRNVLATKQLPEGRKQETLLLLTVLVFLCDLLILSRHALLTSVLLASISWLGIFLSGLAFRGRVEGEAVLKSWLQISLAVALGFGSVLVLALVSGGLHYEVIAAQMKTLPLYSPEALLTIAALCLPFFLAGGIFPFHFITLDRDQGLPWAIQVMLDILVQGAVILAAWKMGVEVFGTARPGQVAEGMRVLQLAGLAGGFWLAIFAFSQENAKRLFSAIVGAQWFAILAAGAMPTKLGVSAITYAFSSVFLWTALLGFVWARLQESVGSDRMDSVHGAAPILSHGGFDAHHRAHRPLYAPGFTGFPSVLHLLASMIEQRSLVFLAAEGGLLAILCLSALRIGTDLLFRPAPERALTEVGAEPRNVFRYGVLDFGAMALLSGSILVLGVFWHHAFAALNDAANLFLP